MKAVNIYTKSSIKSPKAQNGAICYVLETETAKGKRTLEKTESCTGATANQSELRALIEALRHMREPCQLRIYTDSSYVAAGYEKGWVEKWQLSHWMTAKNKEVAHRTEWEELHNLLSIHQFTFAVDAEHEYREWMGWQIQRKLKEEGYV